MDFKLFVAVFCLASIQVSEAVVTWTPTAGTATITECVASGTTIAYTPTAAADGANTITGYTLGGQTPPSTTSKFAVSTAGVLTTVTSTASTFDAETQLSYAVIITATDSSAATGDMIVTVTITSTGCPSSASFVFPSLAVMLISLISLLMKNNN